MFRHPKYYKELRKLRNKLDQVISGASATASVQRAPGPGPSLTRDSNADGSEGSSPKLQATSNKQQASSCKLREEQATSLKPQAASFKLQATSFKLQDLRTTEKFHGP